MRAPAAEPRGGKSPGEGGPPHGIGLVRAVANRRAYLRLALRPRPADGLARRLVDDRVRLRLALRLANGVRHRFTLRVAPTRSTRAPRPRSPCAPAPRSTPSPVG